MNVINLPPAGCEGYYTLTAHKVDAVGNVISSRKLAGPFKNLIVDQGLDRMGDHDFYIYSCQVGSGNATPDPADTSLQTWVAGVNGVFSTNKTVQASSAPYYVALINTYRFGVGVAAGNLSEVGVGWGTSGATLYSRALIVDSGGTPTTITVLSDEVLDVTYELRVYPPTTDVTGTITISGNDYDYIIRACSINQAKSAVGVGWGSESNSGSSAGLGWGQEAYSGAISTIFSQPSGQIGGASSRTAAAYTGGTYYRDLQYVYSITSVTSAIRSVIWASGFSTYQTQFDPPIPKDNTNQLTLVFRHSWARRSI